MANETTKFPSDLEQRVLERNMERATAENERLRDALGKIAKRWPCDTADTMSRLAKETLGDSYGPVGLRPRWRHVKRGTVYEEIGRAELQIATDPGDVLEGSTLVIYRGEDGKLWARKDTEFEDGRFERHTDAE